MKRQTSQTGVQGMDIRFLKPNEATICNDFYNSAYNTNRSLKQWKWDFEPTIFSTKTIPYVVVDDQGEIVGIQALIPIRMVDSDGTFWTAKSEDTNLNPNYRGQQLFKRMYSLIFNYARDNGFAYIWGFTPAERPFRKINFDIPRHTTQLLFPYSRRCVSQLVTQSKNPGLKEKSVNLALRTACGAAIALSSLKSASIRSKSKIYKSQHKLTLKTLTEPPAESGELCSRFIEQWGGKTIYRDADYLRWRIFNNPFLRSTMRAIYSDEQLLGWAIYTINDQGIGILVDILVATQNNTTATPQKIIEILLADAALTLRNMGALAFRGWHVTNHPFDLALLNAAKRIGFYHLKRGHAMVIYTSEAATERKNTSDFENWYVSRIATEGTQG